MAPASSSLESKTGAVVCTRNATADASAESWKARPLNMESRYSRNAIESEGSDNVRAGGPWIHSNASQCSGCAHDEVGVDLHDRWARRGQRGCCEQPGTAWMARLHRLLALCVRHEREPRITSTPGHAGVRPSTADRRHQKRPSERDHDMVGQDAPDHGDDAAQRHHPAHVAMPRLEHGGGAGVRRPREHRRRRRGGVASGPTHGGLRQRADGRRRRPANDHIGLLTGLPPSRGTLTAGDTRPVIRGR